MTNIRQWVAQIAPFINTAEPSAKAVIGYDLFADALKWSDEMPADWPENDDVWSCLRALWRYRTTLMLGTPQDRFREIWDAALEAFPNWPGFRPERRDESLREVYEKAASESLREWRAREQEWEELDTARASQPQAR